MAVFSTDCTQLRCYASKCSNWLIFTNARVTQFMGQYLTFYGRVSLLTAELTNNTYSMSQLTVALDPEGVVRVCTGQNQQFVCTSGGLFLDLAMEYQTQHKPQLSFMHPTISE